MARKFTRNIPNVKKIIIPSYLANTMQTDLVSMKDYESIWARCHQTFKPVTFPFRDIDDPDNPDHSVDINVDTNNSNIQVKHDGQEINQIADKDSATTEHRSKNAEHVVQVSPDEVSVNAQSMPYVHAVDVNSQNGIDIINKGDEINREQLYTDADGYRDGVIIGDSSRVDIVDKGKITKTEKTTDGVKSEEVSDGEVYTQLHNGLADAVTSAKPTGAMSSVTFDKSVANNITDKDKASVILHNDGAINKVNVLTDKNTAENDLINLSDNNARQIVDVVDDEKACRSMTNGKKQIKICMDKDSTAVTIDDDTAAKLRDALKIKQPRQALTHWISLQTPWDSNQKHNIADAIITLIPAIDGGGSNQPSGDNFYKGYISFANLEIRYPNAENHYTFSGKMENITNPENGKTYLCPGFQDFHGALYDGTTTNTKPCYYTIVSDNGYIRLTVDGIPGKYGSSALMPLGSVGGTYLIEAD